MPSIESKPQKTPSITNPTHHTQFFQSLKHNLTQRFGSPNELHIILPENLDQTTKSFTEFLKFSDENLSSFLRLPESEKDILQTQIQHIFKNLASNHILNQHEDPPETILFLKSLLSHYFKFLQMTKNSERPKFFICLNNSDELIGHNLIGASYEESKEILEYTPKMI
jgi:hypothetical protein